jgi:SAM-dependent methyltransferase
MDAIGTTTSDRAAFALHGWGSIDEIIAARGDDLRIDLGCGYYKPAGFIGLDNMSGTGIQIKQEAGAPDVIVDINKDGIPFPDDSCAVVRASHFLEHCNPEFVLKEIYRVLKPGGDLDLILPYANSAEGMYPGHHVFFTERWFEENAWFSDRFRIRHVAYFESEAWKRLPWLVRKLVPFSFARTFLFNACWQMELEATAVKRNH